MTLRWRTLITIGLTLLGLLVIVYVSAERILLGSFAQLEEQELKKDLRRVTSAFEQQIIALDTLNHEWAGWDDTYVFVDDLNPDYIKANLHDQFLGDLDVNLMLFINTNNEVVYSKSFDSVKRIDVPIPMEIYDHLDHGHLSNHPTTESTVTGILTLPGGTMMVSSRPILTSEYLGPIRGTLVMGRYLNQEVVTTLANTVHMSVGLWSYNETLPEDVKESKLPLAQSPFFTRILDDDVAAGYTVINDLDNNPALIVRVDKPRDFYAQGKASLSYFMASFVISGIVFSLVVLYLLERTILARMLNLSSAVDKVRTRYLDLSVSIPVGGQDELSTLAANIRMMLITIRQYQEQLQQANSELEERVERRTQELEAVVERLQREMLEKENALKVKTQILANVSHDARTPLNVITLNVQLLQRYGNLDDKLKARLTNILVSSNQLLNFFNNLLEESRISLGTTRLDSHDFTPHELLQAAITPMRVLVEQKGLVLKTEISPELPSTLYGDLKRLEQILSNLISNAIKFTTQGSIQVRLFRPDELHWAFSVTDTGRGIAVEDQRNIFEEFWQVDGSMTRDVNRGVGLGLSIVKQLVTLMEGVITVQSELGAGSSFTVSLPFHEIEIKETFDV